MLFLSLSIIWVIGTLDDFRPMSVYIRLIAQVIAVSLVVFTSELQIYTLGNILGLEPMSRSVISLFRSQLLG